MPVGSYWETTSSGETVEVARTTRSQSQSLRYKRECPVSFVESNPFEIEALGGAMKSGVGHMVGSLGSNPSTATGLLPCKLSGVDLNRPFLCRV